MIIGRSFLCSIISLIPQTPPQILPDWRTHRIQASSCRLKGLRWPVSTHPSPLFQRWLFLPNAVWQRSPVRTCSLSSLYFSCEKDIWNMIGALRALFRFWYRSGCRCDSSSCGKARCSPSNWWVRLRCSHIWMRFLCGCACSWAYRCGSVHRAKCVAKAREVIGFPAFCFLKGEWWCWWAVFVPAQWFFCRRHRISGIC